MTIWGYGNYGTEPGTMTAWGYPINYVAPIAHVLNVSDSFIILDIPVQIGNVFFGNFTELAGIIDVASFGISPFDIRSSQIMDSIYIITDKEITSSGIFDAEIVDSDYIITNVRRGTLNATDTTAVFGTVILNYIVYNFRR